MQTNEILLRSKWLWLLACGLISISARAAEREITPFQQQAESFSDNTALLIGHWRKTVISYGSVWDEHLVFHSVGTVENWIVTVSSRGAVKVGNWNVEGKKLNIGSTRRRP
jgi:hypothetical protein